MLFALKLRETYNMRDKRGDFTVNEVLGLIIAAIGIGIVIFGAYKLYEVTINQESDNAKALLNSLEGKINSLNNNELGRFQMRGVKEWFLVGWGKNDAGRIDKCFFESCICICKGNEFDLKDSCQLNGFCKNVNSDIVSVFEFEKIIGKEVIDANGQVVKEEEVIEDILNPKYNESRNWVKDEVCFGPLLKDQCPRFYESNLVEILAYKSENSIAVLKISQKERQLVPCGAVCKK